MIRPQRLYDFLQEKGIDFYAGVPDSLLKSFLKYIQDHAGNTRHVITANEGLAIGLAAGHYFVTDRLPLVYLQNSGLGNTINPLTSLADQEMYSVPLLLLIGWRGKPGHKDEPQHIKMGRITIPLLETLEIPVYELERDEEKSLEAVRKAIEEAVSKKIPVALLAEEGIFEEYGGIAEKNEYKLEREDVIGQLINRLEGNETVVCTTGKIGREFYEQNLKAKGKINKYLLSAGAMGHAGHIALGINMASGEKVIMLDGDGALLMHLGALPVMAEHARDNFIHIVINNGSHESVGGQPTGAFAIDLCKMANACGYKDVRSIVNEKELSDWLTDIGKITTAQFVEIRTTSGSRSDLGRPAGTPIAWKEEFMNAFKSKK